LEVALVSFRRQIAVDGRFFNFSCDIRDELADRFIGSGMRLIDNCPNCFSSTSSDEASAVDGARRKRRRKLFLPSLALGDGKIAAREYYSKFYTSAAVQPKSFCAGKNATCSMSAD
jgi:hypothetical protein